MVGGPITVLPADDGEKLISFGIKETIGMGVYNPVASSRFRLPPEGVVVPIDEDCLGQGYIPECLRLLR